MLFQSQQKSFIVANKDNLLPIQDVQAESKGYQTFSDKNGRIIFFYDRATEITLSHINYTTLTIPISQIKDTVFMTLSQFESDVTITADRIKLVQAGVSETKRENVKLPQTIINNIPEVNTSIKSLSQVVISEDINGQNFINVLGSNDNEVHYFINDLSMFSYGEQQNYSSLVLTQLLKDINLDIGSRDNYLASINLNIDQYIQPQWSVSLGENEYSLRRNFVFRDQHLISISGFNYTHTLSENEIKDDFETYDYNFSTDKYNFNDFLYLKLGDWQINNILLLEYKSNTYLDDIYLNKKKLINGISIKKDQWKANIEVLGSISDYQNKTDFFYEDFRKTSGFQGKFNFSKTLGDSINGLYAEYEYLVIHESIDSKFGIDRNNSEDDDTQHTVTLNQKFIPDTENTDELKTVLELGLSISKYQDDFFVKSGSVKTALIFDLKPALVDFYVDLNFGKVPLYKVNQLYLSAKTDTITNYLQNTNMTFGAKVSYKNLIFDVSYSTRDYKSYLSKIYNTIYNEFQIYTNNQIGSLNFKFDVTLNKYVRTNSSLMFTSTDDFKQFSNKPEFLQTHNVIFSYQNMDLQINVKNESDKYITYELNETLYQRAISNSQDVSIFYSINRIFNSSMNVSLMVTNLLEDNIYTLNGFYNKKRKFLGSVSYEF